MENEQTNTPDTQGTETDKPVETPKPTTPLLENAALIRDALKVENDRTEENIKKLTELQQDKMLGGTAGGHVESVPKVETDEEFADKFHKGEVNLFK